MPTVCMLYAIEEREEKLEKIEKEKKAAAAEAANKKFSPGDAAKGANLFKVRYILLSFRYIYGHVH